MDQPAPRILENAIVRLLKRRPFYGYLLLGCRRRAATAGYPLGATLAGGIPTLEVDPERFALHAPEEQEALLQHVLAHLLHLHPVRRRGRSEHDWDVACDLAVNPGIDGLPAGALLPERFRLPPGLAAEEYYRLVHAPFDSGNLDGGGFGNGSPDEGGRVERAAAEALRDAKTLDDHALWQQADGMPAGLAEEVVRGMVRDAVRQSRGEVPGELRALIDGWMAPTPIPWRQVLRQFVAAAGRVGRRSTWKREHRRFAHTTPGIRKHHRLQLLVGVDVSDSTGGREEREAFARELVRIARGRDTLLTVLYAGSRIQKIESFKGGAAVAEAYHGGGFTDLRPVFDYARTMQPRPAAVIYLTDGFGPAPERMELPTLWVLTKEGKKPAAWGVELRLEA